MKINQLISEMATVAGSVASVAKPMGETQKRPNVRGLQPVGSATKKKKAPYANSLSEGKMKDLSMDLKSTKDGLNDAEFKKKYGKSKEEMRKSMQQNPKQPVQEAQLDEEDLILVPGQGIKRKTGFVQHGQSRVDHEVEMAKSDLLQLLKNTKTVMMLIKDRSEDEGLEGWVQEKIIKASDYMNTLAEYLEGKSMQEMSGGVIAGGGVGESVEEAKGKLTYTPEPTEYGVFPDSKNEFVKTFLSKDLALAHIKKFGGKLVVLDQYGRRIRQGVAEAFQNDEANLYYKYDPSDGRLKQRMVNNNDERQAFAQGYKDTPEQALKAAGIIRSKFDPKKFIQNQGGKWVQVYPYGKQDVAEGEKVDRMVKHIASSERGLGHSKKEAENIAWATANKRGMLDNKNKKK